VIGRLAAAAGVLALASCMAPPPTDVSVRKYDVSGTTLSALERSLSTHGPVVPGLEGRAFAAVETTFVHNFEPVEANGRCRYTRDGRVGLRSEVILPEWRQRDSAPPDLREKWDIISRYAAIHEAGHIKISQKYARQLEQAYRGASAPTCEELDARMSAAIEPIAAAHVAEQRRFDETDEPRFRAYLRRYGYSIDS
jgi:predicted secreted Zn-dependent protease